MEESRSTGGFLAEKKMASAQVKAEALQKNLALALAERLVGTLGREPSNQEIDPGQGPESSRAKSLAASGNWEEAKKIWLEILTQNPNYAPALYNLGLYSERLGELENARSYFRAAFLNDSKTRSRAALARVTKVLMVTENP